MCSFILQLVNINVFTHAWEQRTLGEVTEVKTGPFGSTLHAEDYVEDGMPIITTGHFKSGELPTTKYGVPQVSAMDYIRLKSYFLEQNDIVFSRVGSVDVNALVSEIQDGWLFSGRVLRVRPLKNIVGQFLHYELDTTRAKNDVVSRAVGQTMPSINTEILSNTNVYISKSIEEQTAIGNFFRILDDTITLHKRKLDALKELKRGYLQQMFPQAGESVPRIRFAGFTEPWQVRKLGDVVERITRKNKGLESTLVLTISAQYGLVAQKDFFEKEVASKDVSGYYLVKNGEFAYNKSYSNGYPWGAVKRLDNYETGVLSTLYIVFKPATINSEFLAQYYETTCWHNEVAQYAAEGARNHGLLNIATSDFFDTLLTIPINSSEQAKIGDFFQILDKQIIDQEQKFSQLKQLKSAYLQKMLV